MLHHNHYLNHTPIPSTNDTTTFTTALVTAARLQLTKLPWRPRLLLLLLPQLLLVVMLAPRAASRGRSFLGPKSPVLLQLQNPQQRAQPYHGSLVTTLQKRVHGVSTHRGGASLRAGPLIIIIIIIIIISEGLAEGQVARGGRAGVGVGGGGSAGGGEEEVEGTAAESKSVQKIAALTEQRGEKDHIPERPDQLHGNPATFPASEGRAWVTFLTTTAASVSRVVYTELHDLPSGLLPIASTSHNSLLPRFPRSSKDLGSCF